MDDLDVCDAEKSGMDCYHILTKSSNGIFHASSYVEWPKLGYFINCGERRALMSIFDVDS